MFTELCCLLAVVRMVCNVTLLLFSHQCDFFPAHGCYADSWYMLTTYYFKFGAAGDVGSAAMELDVANGATRATSGRGW